MPIECQSHSTLSEFSPFYKFSWELIGRHNLTDVESSDLSVLFKHLLTDISEVEAEQEKV